MGGGGGWDGGEWKMETWRQGYLNNNEKNIKTKHRAAKVLFTLLPGVKRLQIQVPAGTKASILNK